MHRASAIASDNLGHVESSEELARRFAPVYAKLAHLIPEAEWRCHLPLIAEIHEWKRRRNAIVLAHNYQTPEIFHGIADFHGDSLALARHAQTATAEVVLMCGVHFMAETVKLLCPDKLVLLPSLEAGCSLASSVTAHDVRQLRREYPGVPVVCYVNTSAAVKAECDVCCTSANAVAVVRALNVPRVIMLPDAHLAQYVASQTDIDIISWNGECEVHMRFSRGEIDDYRNRTGAFVLAHPECRKDVQEGADFVGSTSAMIAELQERQPKSALLVTECSMADNVSASLPHINFVRPCNLCSYMKQITLAGVLSSLKTLTPRIAIDPRTAQRARITVQRMLG